MRKYLIHDVLSKRIRITDSLNSSVCRQLFQNEIRNRLFQIATDSPSVFCLNNIQNYLSASSLPWYESILEFVKTNSPSNTHSSENLCQASPPFGFFENLNHPLARFPHESVWMETTKAPLVPAGNHSSATGWMISRGNNRTNSSLMFMEFNRFPNGQVEMSSITSLPLDELDRIAQLNGPAMIKVCCIESNTMTSHQQIRKTPRLYLPLFALNILRTKNGFSMPIEEQGRRQLARRIGVRNNSENYFFDVGPKMKHFVRGHFRVYTARQQTPLTVWVHPHTRGNRRPMLPDQHRRRSPQPAVDVNTNALQCTTDG